MPRPRRNTPLGLFLIAGLALPLSALAAQPANNTSPRAAAAAAAAAPAQPAAAEELRLRRITLYRSGVGFFQREAVIAGAADLQLRFKTEQINDILKSMVLLDLDGGQIQSVSYGSKDPLSRRLAAFGINIADNPSIADLLGRLRGADVSIVSVDGNITGTILGVEKRPTVVAAGAASAPPAVINQDHLSLITRDGIRTVSIAGISSFTLTDRQLADELNRALAALAEHRAETTKTVNIAVDGPEGAGRRVVAAYVHEMPVWKTSYRLILPDAPAPAAAAPADDRRRREAAPATSTLQGWAIVENTTDEDWRDVRLSLVAGRPVSFQMDLYEPLYLRRPQIPVPTVPGVMPRQYAGAANVALDKAVAGQAGDNRAMDRRMLGRAAEGAPARGIAPAAEAQADAMYGLQLGHDDLTAYAPAARSEAGQVGEVFQYELTTPISVARQQSAMIPFMSATIPARRVSIFNLTDRADHPMRGVEITNPGAADGGPGGGLQLLPGPISVFDGPAYAGDATIGHIPAGDKRLLAYAVDLDVAVITKPESTTNVTSVRIVDGAVELTQRTRHSLVYGFENKDSTRGRTILVEHPRMADWDLIEPAPREQADAPETTQTHYRFELDVGPGRTGTLPVVQERTDRQTYAVSNFDLGTILAYHRDGKASDRVVETFRRVAQMQAGIREMERAIAELDRQVKAITDDQSRIRGNIGAIERNSDLYRRYITRLNEQENELEQLATRRAEHQQTLESRRAELSEFLRNLNVE